MYPEGVPIDSMVFVDERFLEDLPMPQYGDPGYDYGVTDDGWVRPGPCPICGAIDWTCTQDYSNPTLLLPSNSLLPSEHTLPTDIDV